MADENKDKEEVEIVPNYEQIATQEPEREVDLSQFQAPKTTSEEEEHGEAKSDFAVFMKSITPRYADKDLDKTLQPVHVARIFPDNMLDSCKMTVLAWLIKHEPTNNDIDIWGAIHSTHIAHSIGYEGRGIADRLEGFGAVSSEEMEKLSKGLGL